MRGASAGWLAMLGSPSAYSSRQTFLETLADHALGQFATDEDDPAFALLIAAPIALVVAVEHHVDTLEREALRIVLEGEDALGTQDVAAFLGDEVLDPRKEPVGIERLVGPDRQGLHLLVMVMLEPAMIVAVVVMIIMMVVMVTMIVTLFVVIVLLATIEERRLDLEDAVEVERIAAKHRGERHRAALGAVEARIRIDGADAPFDLGEVGCADEVRLVDEDHVGKGDLVLGLRGVAQAFLEPLGIGDRHDGVELRLAGKLRIDEESLGDRGRVGEPGGLDDDR